MDAKRKIHLYFEYCILCPGCQFGVQIDVILTWIWKEGGQRGERGLTLRSDKRSFASLLSHSYHQLLSMPILSLHAAIHNCQAQRFAQSAEQEHLIAKFLTALMTILFCCLVFQARNQFVRAVPTALIETG